MFGLYDSVLLKRGICIEGEVAACDRIIRALIFILIPAAILIYSLATQLHQGKVFWFNWKLEIVVYGLMMQLLCVHVHLLTFNVLS